MIHTEQNLQSAFARESQTMVRYLLYAEKAEKQGYPLIARAFRAASEAEMVHIRNIFNAMTGAGSVKDNLLACVITEEADAKKIYPEFIYQAREERAELARNAFEMANKGDQIHYDVFNDTLEGVKSDREITDEPYYVCQICGNMVKGAAPDTCSICSTSRDKFKKIM